MPEYGYDSFSDEEENTFDERKNNKESKAKDLENFGTMTFRKFPSTTNDSSSNDLKARTLKSVLGTSERTRNFETLELPMDDMGRTPAHICILLDDQKSLERILLHAILEPVDVWKKSQRNLLRSQSIGVQKLDITGRISASQMSVELEKQKLLLAEELERERRMIDFLSLTDENGWTMLHYAAQSSMCSRLIWNSKYWANFPAIRKLKMDNTGGILRKIKTARKQLADTVESVGYSALHVAAIHANNYAIKQLLEMEADKYIENAEGEMAADLALDEATRRALNAKLTTAINDYAEANDATQRRTIMKSINTTVEIAEARAEREGIRLESGIHRAAACLDEDVLETMLKTMKVDSKDASLWTPLHYCVHAPPSSNQRACIDLLLEYGADINTKTIRNQTVLHLAVNAGVETAIEDVEHQSKLTIAHLIRNGAKMNVQDDQGFTPLMLAAKHGLVLAAWELIRSGCRLHKTMSNGWNALHVGCYHGHTEIVRVLAYADVDRQNLRTTRNLQGKIPVDLSKTSESRDAMETAWDFCRMGNLHALRKMLIQQNGRYANATWNIHSINDKTFQNGRTLLHYTVIGERGMRDNLDNSKGTEDGLMQVLKFLLADETLNIDSSDFDGKTPLMCACEFGRYEAVQLLLERGADITCVDCGGNTPLHWAYAFKRMKVTDLLGVTSDVQNMDGHSPLQVIGCRQLPLPQRPNRYANKSYNLGDLNARDNSDDDDEEDEFNRDESKDNEASTKSSSHTKETLSQIVRDIDHKERDQDSK